MGICLCKNKRIKVWFKLEFNPNSCCGMNAMLCNIHVRPACVQNCIDLSFSGALLYMLWWQRTLSSNTTWLVPFRWTRTLPSWWTTHSLSSVVFLRIASRKSRKHTLVARQENLIVLRCRVCNFASPCLWLLCNMDHRVPWSSTADRSLIQSCISGWSLVSLCFIINTIV